MRHLVGALCLVAAASAAFSREAGPAGLAIAAGSPAAPEWVASDLPPEPLAREAAACPFASTDPMRLVHLLGVAGAGAIRAEEPFRRAHARACTR